MGAVISLCKNCFGAEETRESYNTIPGEGGGGTTGNTPDPDERRRQLAEAAEKRLKNQEHRGIQNPESVRRQQQRKEEMEKREEELARLGNTGEPLRWQVS
ncbi:Small VCP/p97-interacting protein [Orchesella cincta]|uniref:Small VCP/p97-interacting protein n=1 Tax=Orchesella cincta TaxID=48709 RepID=A0A1D2N6N1_ORCCI|nr:Small VCP/p97-interacting protein [Orchesella cincta]